MSEAFQPDTNDANLELEIAPEMPEGEGETNADDNPFQEFVRHQRIALEELGRAIESLLPKEFRDHANKAGQAFVESFRALVDATRETVENATRQGEGEQVEKEGPAPTKIKVELD